MIRVPASVFNDLKQVLKDSKLVSLDLFRTAMLSKELSPATVRIDYEESKAQTNSTQTSQKMRMYNIFEALKQGALIVNHLDKLECPSPIEKLVLMFADEM